MTGGQASHFTVSYRDGGVQIASVYAVNEDISREFSLLKLSGKDLRAWLESRGCRLDSSDGPAVVWHNADGLRTEYYYRNGKPHREDGPAYVVRYADGAIYEAYYLDGVKLRKDEYNAKTHPLLMGLRLSPTDGGELVTIDDLLREAIAEQSGVVRSKEREYIPLPQP